MPKHPKWYRLSFRGSLTSPNDFANRKISNAHYESTQSYKFTESFFNEKSTRAIKGRKSPKRPKPKEIMQNDEKSGITLEQCDPFQIQQSRVLNEFARELRYRELKHYYAKLIESERCSRKIIYMRTCPECGLIKPQIDHRDISKNVYCWGPETMLQKDVRIS